MTDIPDLTDAEAAVLRCEALSPEDDFASHESVLVRGFLTPLASPPVVTDLGKQALAAYDAQKRAEIRLEVIRECAAAIDAGYHDDEYGVGMANASRILGDLARNGKPAPTSLDEAIAQQRAEIEEPLRIEIAERDDEIVRLRALLAKERR